MQVCQKLAHEVAVISRERYLEAWEGHKPDRVMLGKHKENIAALMHKYFPPEHRIKEVCLDLKYSYDSKMCFVVVYQNIAKAGAHDDWSTHGCEVTASLSDLFTVKVKGLERSDGNDTIRQYMILQLMKEVDNG
jgi:hypothetical protein